MRLGLRELAVILRPFNTETARRLCLRLIDDKHLFPECISNDNFVALELKRGQSAASSFESAALIQPWLEYVKDKDALQDYAFEEAKPEALAKDLERLQKALIATGESKWREQDSHQNDS